MEGVKFDQGKLRVDLLSVPAMEGTAAVLTHGANKYGERNWEKGLSWGRCYGALLRHLFAWWRGEDYDRESGMHHLHHAACELMFLQHFVITGSGQDNRKRYDTTSEEVVKQWKKIHVMEGVPDDV